MMKPLRLGSHKGSQASPVPAPSPSPTFPERPESVVESDASMAEVRLAYRADGVLAAPRPTPSPPFRLLPPSAPPSERERRMSDHMPPPEMSRHHLTPPIDPMRSMLPDASSLQQQADDRGDLRAQLRSRPLTSSFLGQKIVNLLTQAWVVAPSGLIACRFPDETLQEDINDVADAINLLNCGAEALAHPAAGVLALAEHQRLNALLSRCGISPIVAKPAPVDWLPLAARSPAPFLLEGFQMRRLPRRDSDFQ